MSRASACPLRVGEVKERDDAYIYRDDGCLVARCVDPEWAKLIVSWSRIAPELGRLARVLQQHEDGLIDDAVAFERMRSVLIGKA
jgi:hypothetical protein